MNNASSERALYCLIACVLFTVTACGDSANLEGFTASATSTANAVGTADDPYEVLWLYDHSNFQGRVAVLSKRPSESRVEMHWNSSKHSFILAPNCTAWFAENGKEDRENEHDKQGPRDETYFNSSHTGLQSMGYVKVACDEVHPPVVVLNSSSDNGLYSLPIYNDTGRVLDMFDSWDDAVTDVQARGDLRNLTDTGDLYTQFKNGAGDVIFTTFTGETFGSVNLILPDATAIDFETVETRTGNTCDPRNRCFNGLECTGTLLDAVLVPTFAVCAQRAGGGSWCDANGACSNVVGGPLR